MEKRRIRNRPRMQEQQKRYRRNLRLRAIAKVASGPENGGRVCCAVPSCGIVDPDKLEIDHIEGGGRKHLAMIAGSWTASCCYTFYRWIMKQNDLRDFRLLCRNHNAGHQFDGIRFAHGEIPRDQWLPGLKVYFEQGKST